MRPTISNIHKCYRMIRRRQPERVGRHVNKRQKDMHISIALIDFVASNRECQDRKNMREIYQSVLRRFIDGPPKALMEKMAEDIRRNPSLALIQGATSSEGGTFAGLSILPPRYVRRHYLNYVAEDPRTKERVVTRVPYGAVEYHGYFPTT